ncbi:dihydroneopterin aldolase 2-like [Hevea brasiliensis]|uniref:dihydroneopterin aldolase 2-like n=1 Tax=Hevea brasiliensis TaxID=3981 RepID=UPI0025D988ED|nr:dihydroneopterin aldolase 2-like [Hevea brasiliensis]
MMENDKIIGGDTLILGGLKFRGFHGVKAERTLGQKFMIDVDAWMDLRAAGKSNQQSDTLSYAEIYRYLQFTEIQQLLRSTISGRTDRLSKKSPNWVEVISYPIVFRRPERVSRVRIGIGELE